MDKEKKQEKVLMAKEALKAIQNLEESTRLEIIIKDNKIEFESGNKNFRVRKPNLAEQMEIDNVRRKKYLELVRDDSYLFRKQWIDVYKKKGIDIVKMESDIKRIEAEINKLLLRLAKSADKKIIKDLENQILKLRDEMYSLSLEKTDLLSYSVEDQITVHAKSYAAYLVLERKEGDKWIKHFEDFETFQKLEDVDLASKLFYNFDYLINSGYKNEL